MNELIYKKNNKEVFAGFVLVVLLFLFILSSVIIFSYSNLLQSYYKKLARQNTTTLVYYLEKRLEEKGTGWIVNALNEWHIDDSDAGLVLLEQGKTLVARIEFYRTENFDFEISENFRLEEKDYRVTVYYSFAGLKSEKENFLLIVALLVLSVVVFFASVMWLYLKKNILIPAHTDIKEQENKYMTIMENVGMGIAVINRDYRIVSMNRTMREWFPDIDTEKIPVCYESFNKPAGTGKCTYCPVTKTFSSGSIQTTVTTTPTSEGDRHFRIISSPIKNRRGVVDSALEVVEDITEEVLNKQKLEVTLRQNKILLEVGKEVLRANDEYDLLKRIPQVIVKHGGYKLCWIGYKDQDSSRVFPVGQAGFEEGYLDSITVTYDDLPSGRGPMGAAVRTGQIYKINDINKSEEFIPWREEAIKRGYASVASFPLIYGPKIIGAIAVYSDKPDVWNDNELELMNNLADDIMYGILFHRSEDGLLQAHELLEKRVRQRTKELDMAIRELRLANEELAALNKTKSEFLAVISHDIRTPMNGILGMAQLLMDSNLDEDQKHDLEIIKSNGEILIQLINDILDLSKIESGVIELEEIPFDLKSLLASLMKAFEWNSSVKGIRLLKDIQEDIPQQLLGDPHRLKQVFLNLVGNAVKFTDQGFVRISASITDKNNHEVEILFRVTDSGIGIPPDRQEDIFKSYTQADKSISRKFGGTGLGTTIAQNLVNLMGGKIQITSPVNYGTEQGGAGSEFYFKTRFKITDNPVIEEAVAENKTAFIPDNIKILVAEDNKVNQLLIGKILKKLNVDFDIVEDGVLAVENGKSGNYNIIFMDVNMPEMGGLEASRKLRDLGIKIPIIAVTADSIHEEQDKMLENGITGSIMKPFKIEEISGILNRYFA